MRSYKTGRFFTAIYILVMVLLVVRAWYFYDTTREDVEKIVFKGVRSALVEAVDRIKEELSRDDPQLSIVRNYLTRVETNSDMIEKLSFVEQGRVVFSSDPRSIGKRFDPAEGRSILRIAPSDVLGTRTLYLTDNYYKNGTSHPFTVVATVSRRFVDKVFYDKMERLIFYSVVIPGIVLIFIAWMVRRTIILPVEELEGMVERRETRFTPHFALSELNDLGEALSRTFGQIREQIRALDYMAMYDKLTKLPNRNFMQNHIDKLVEESERTGEAFSMLFLDLDNFKQINDTEGHDVGDRILREVSERLEALLEENETVGRIGGDEFLWLTHRSDRADLERLTERIIAELNRPFKYASREYHIGVSVGVATFPEDGENRIALTKNADIALYEAKRKGRNRAVFFDEKLAQVLLESSRLEREMEHALEAGEFVVLYQPKVSVSGGEVEGGEALLRWNHPEHGTIPPDHFIPIAEKNGFIIRLGRYVIEEACRTIKRLETQGRDLRIAVNLSAVQVRPELLEEIEAIVAQSGIRKSSLQLEITETVLMESFEESVKTLNALSDAGYHICLDDFGTGYSSLAYLRIMPVKTLKIDKSFIMQLDTYEHSRALVQGIVALGHALELEVVAEGVENEEILAFLRQCGCDEYQGYLFSPPVPLEEFFQKCGLGPEPDGAQSPSSSS